MMVRRSLIVAASAFLLGFMPDGYGQSPEPRQPPSSERAALDPLTQEEEATALRIARADGRVKEALAVDNVRVVSVIPVLIKRGDSPEKLDLHQREIEVTLFQPQTEVGARVLVNLREGSIASLQRLSSAQVPFTNDDLKEAFQLALRDAQVQRALGPAAESFRIESERPPTATAAVPENVVSALPVRSNDPNDPCSKHRCLELFFRRGTDYLNEPIVTVDLSAKHVTVERNQSR